MARRVRLAGAGRPADACCRPGSSPPRRQAGSGSPLAWPNATRTRRWTARRLALRHTELRQGMSAGLWRLHLLAGAADPEAAARVAGLLCACADTSGLPYALAPSGCRTASPARTARRPDPGTPGQPRPTRPPRSRSAAAPRCSPRWPRCRRPRCPASGWCCARTSTSPWSRPRPTGIRRRPRFGWAPCWTATAARPGHLSLPAASLNRHTFVCGATGAGKSQTVRALLEAASAAHLPWLVVEPAKSEYRLMSVRLTGVEVVRIRPGEADQVAAGINPLRPAAWPGRPAVPAADPRGPGPGAVPGLVRGGRAVPAGAVRGGDAGVRAGRLGPGARRAGRARRPAGLSRRSVTCRRRPSGW